MGRFAGAVLFAVLARASADVAIRGAAGRQDEVAADKINPIRRVVSMLQKMVAKVTAEGKIEQELFDKFMCWCETGATELETAISCGTTKVPQLGSKIEEVTAQIAQLKADIAKEKDDRKAALEAIASLKVTRTKGHAAFLKSQVDLNANIAALKKAIAALEKGVAGAGFLQTNTAAVLRQLTLTVNLKDSDRDVLSAFLAGGQTEDSGYAPQSGEVIGILKQMLDTMVSELKDETSEETAGITNFELMLAAKLKLTSTLDKSIEEKLTRLGGLMVELVNLKEDQGDTTSSLEEDKKFLADMDDICEKKRKEWALRQKTRSEELAALADTITILNSDDSLEMFKKTLPSASLLQVATAGAEVRRKAVEALALSHGKGQTPDYRVAFITMALKGGKVSFAKVISMVDKMITLLGDEQVSDDGLKAYCDKSIDTTEDDMKDLEHSLTDMETAIADLKEMIATLTDEIAALGKGIKDLDKQIAEATEDRKEEHDDFNEGLAANSAAKDILGIAKNRLSKFYNPTLYKAPPKRELEPELAQEAPELLQLGLVHGARRQPTSPPPATWEPGYQKKGQANNGVMAMMDELEAELDKDIQEMTVDEKNAQTEYEELVTDSAKKRADDVHSLANKEGAKAGAEVDLEKMATEHKNTKRQAMAKAEELRDLHLACDWSVSNYSIRKEARAGEVEALKKAKAVLAGADYALVQSHVATRRLRA